MFTDCKKMANSVRLYSVFFFSIFRLIFSRMKTLMILLCCKNGRLYVFFFNFADIVIPHGYEGLA